MALIAIQGPRPRGPRGPTILEQIAQGVSIATDILGVGLQFKTLDIKGQEVEAKRGLAAATETTRLRELSEKVGRETEKEKVRVAELGESIQLAGVRNIEDDFQDLGDIVNNSSQRRERGRNMLGVSRANNGLRLIGIAPNEKVNKEKLLMTLNDLTPQQKRELTVVLDTITKGGGASTESGVEELVVKSLIGDLREVLIRVINEPLGTGEGTQLLKIVESIVRERDEALGRLLFQSENFERQFKRAAEADIQRFDALVFGTLVKEAQRFPSLFESLEGKKSPIIERILEIKKRLPQIEEFELITLPDPLSDGDPLDDFLKDFGGGR